MAPEPVSIQPGVPASRPLFCVHAEAGEVSLYHGLARHLARAQPVLGLCAPPVAELGGERASFEQLAEHHVRTIRATQPAGPYMILGECTGGALAYEIARQLRGAGEEVAPLALIDAFPRGTPPLARHMPRALYRMFHRARILGFHSGNLVRLPGRARLEYAAAKASRARRALTARVASRRRVAPALSTPQLSTPPLSAQAVFAQALAAYSPQPHAGSAVLLRAARLPLGVAAEGEDLGWGRLLEEVEVETVPGYFTTPISEPGVRALAERLSRHLHAGSSPGGSLGPASARSEGRLDAAAVLGNASIWSRAMKVRRARDRSDVRSSPRHSGVPQGKMTARRRLDQKGHMLTPPHTPGYPAPELDGAAELDGAGNLTHGVFESPSSPAFGAIARHKWLVFALAVLCALGGVWYGHSRPSTYTASATLQVGQVNPNSPGFFGYVQSAGALATAFSRAVEAEPVLQAAERKLKLTHAQAVARLSAATIPVSPAFRVIATGPTEHAAVALANVAAQAVIAYEGHSNSTNPEAASLLREYREASVAYRRAVANAAKLAEQSPHKGGYSSALAAAEAERNAAKVKLDAVGVAYTDAVSSRAPSSGLVSLIAGAATASSNHHSKVELYGFIGLLVGIVLGCVAAILLGGRRGAAPPTLAGGREDAKQGIRAA